MTAHCFGALSQVRAIGHCVIGQERDLLKSDWLNWWVCPWVPAFEIQIFLTPQNPGTHGLVWGNICPYLPLNGGSPERLLQGMDDGSYFMT